ncbi:hypothetical protein AVEN_33009-1, partial [Araneus ventricosus]
PLDKATALPTVDLFVGLQALKKVTPIAVENHFFHVLLRKLNRHRWISDLNKSNPEKSNQSEACKTWLEDGPSHICEEILNWERRRVLITYSCHCKVCCFTVLGGSLW